MKRNARFLVPFVALLLLLGSTAPASAQLRGMRYCEVLAVFPGQGGLVADVWNTTGFNLCPAADWEALDADAIRGELAAAAVFLNGPRYWMLDRLAGNAPLSDVRDFGALTMRRVATVEVPLSGTATPYAPVSVNRDTQFFFDAGSEIYELVDPEGRVFVMQSYSQIADPALVEADLPGLGGRLVPPEGWTYRVRVLEADLVVEDQDGVATVVQDELQNTYQLVAPASPGDDACDAEPVIRTTPAGVEFVRTPDACFDSLPGWPYAPQYVEIDGLRQAYVDEGSADGPVVLLLHGQPSWSYLYRKMIPVLADAGYRVIAMDHLGMGRSDKPTDIASYSYLGHGDRLERFIEALDLREINLFVQDWGALIGLRVAGLNYGRFARIAVGNGLLPVIPAGTQPFPPVENPNEIEDIAFPFPLPPQQPPLYDGCRFLIPRQDNSFFGVWMNYAMKSSSFRPSVVLEALTWFDLPADEEAAYDAPFPSRIYMAGPRVFPSLINEVPGTNEEASRALDFFQRPFLTLWASNDPGAQGSCEAQQSWIDKVPGATGQPHDRLPESSHFLQDDQGVEIATRLVDFYASPALDLRSSNRGSRYCEILLGSFGPGGATAEVWGTPGLNPCPAELWEALDADTIRAEEGAAFVIMNGPRYSLPDSGRIILPDARRTFGDLDMQRLATLTVDPSMIAGRTPYSELTVLRETAFEYWAGSEIYELVAPDGTAYAMISSSQIVDPELTLEQLPDLASRLALPEGWSFRARTLAADLIAVAGGVAVVLQDELQNTYQRVGAVTECSDGIDNDADGSADYGADFGCDAHDDASERSAELQCDDGIDNDGDGRSDFDPVTRADSVSHTAGSGDPGCIHPLGHEAPPCSDGLDNDEDGLFDWDGAGLGDADPDCSGPDDYYEETGCGLGFELVFLLPLLIAARGRARGVVVSGERSGA